MSKTYWFFTKTGKLWRFYWVEGLTGPAKKRQARQRRKLKANNNLFETKPTPSKGTEK